METLNMERVYIAGDDNILGDAPSRAPADRAVARNLAIPLAPIKRTMHRMFWAPDELAGSTATRLQQLKVENPGILTYLPDELLATHGIINEARPEDEVAEPPAAFEPAGLNDEPKDVKPKPKKKSAGESGVQQGKREAGLCEQWGNARFGVA